MKNAIVIFFSAVLIFSSCVSKKKYMQMQDEKTAEKNVLDEVLNKLAVENDSLTKLIYSLDSLYRSERDKNNLASNKGVDRSFKVKPRRSLISGKEEYDKKAIFLYNFLSYIFWPADPKAENFTIGIVGESPIKQALVAQVYGKSVNKQPILVENYVPGNTYKILFFTEAGQSQFNRIKKLCVNKTVLFITENTILENIGSHISLYVDGTKIRFTANKSAIDKTKLKVSNSFYGLSD
ncbi:MAG: YfiR family protein [Bacteroidia bacterium]|nr:YfiR family protein [Bacteroidia bacterium]